MLSCNSNCFSKDTYNNATLYLSEEGVKHYSSVTPWNLFNKVEAYDFSAGVEEISDDSTGMGCEYYNLNGVRVNENGLAPGLYIKVTGGKAEKIVVR